MRDPKREIALEDVASCSDPFELVDDMDLLQRVWKAARPADRAVLQLLFDGLPLPEIARRLRISSRVAERRVARLRHIVRELVGDGLLEI
jgi:DNA-directed RNA polymerase specialized sigma24 family protein